MGTFTEDEVMGSGRKTYSEDEVMSKPGILGNKPDATGQDPYGGVKNATTSAIKGVLGSTAGLPGEVGNMLELLGAAGKWIGNRATGLVPPSGVDAVPFMPQGGPKDTRSAIKIMEDNNKARETKAFEYAQHRRQHLGLPPLKQGTPGPFDGRWTTKPAGAEELYSLIKPYIGEYEPQTIPGKLFGAGIQASVPGSAISLAGKAKAGERILKEAPNLLEKIGSAVKPPVVTGAGGVTGETANLLSGGDPYWTLAGSLVGPLAAETGLSATKSTSISREQAARKAGKQYAADIREHGEDPQTVFRNAQGTYDTLPDWHTEKTAPSLAEAGKSRALAQSEVAAGLNAATGTQIAERNAQRNAARKGAAGSTVDDLATGEEPTNLFKDHLRELDERVDSALPKVGENEELGKGIRDPLIEGRKSAEQARTELYDDLEKRFGDQTMLIPGLKQAAEDLTAHRPGFTVRRSPDEHTSLALNMPKEVTFGNLRAYLKDINLELQNARGNPNKTAEVGRLKRLKSGVMDDINDAVVNWAKRDEELAASGHIGADDTITEGFKRKRDEWLAARKMEEGEPGTGGSFPPRTAGIPGVSSAGSAARSERPGTSGAGGTEAVSGGSGRVDTEASAALKAANDAQTYLGQTYRQGTPGQLLRENGFKGAWNITDSKVPRTAFPGGPDGYTITKSVLKAGQNTPEMLQALKDTAIMTLRNEMEGGRLTEAALSRWQKKYRTSLNAIDDVEPGFSAQFNNLANTQSAMAAKFAGAADVGEATNFMGNVLNQTNGASILRNLVNEAKGEPAVIEGFKKLIIDHMGQQADRIAGGQGDWGLAMKKQIDRYHNVMKEVFDPEHMRVMDELVQDVVNQQEHYSRMRPPVAGSPTAHRLQLLKDRLQDPGPTHNVTGGAGPTIATMELAREGLSGGIPALKTVLMTMGIDHVGRFVQGMRNRGIRNVNEMYRAGMVDPQLGMRMLRHGLEEHGSDTWAHRVGSALEASPLYSQPGLQEAEKKRRGHAGGGRVHDSQVLARRLIESVETARRMQARESKPILQQPDNVVAQALAIAGRHS